MRLAEPGRAWGDSTAAGAKLLRVDDFNFRDPTAQREPSWRGWTPCEEYVPESGKLCRLRVRGRGMIFGTDRDVREVTATYGPAGWILEGGGRLAEGYAAVAWRYAS
jgi:hypothetical protein